MLLTHVLAAASDVRSRAGTSGLGGKQGTFLQGFLLALRYWGWYVVLRQRAHVCDPFSRRGSYVDVITCREKTKKRKQRRPL